MELSKFQRRFPLFEGIKSVVQDFDIWNAKALGSLVNITDPEWMELYKDSRFQKDVPSLLSVFATTVQDNLEKIDELEIKLRKAENHISTLNSQLKAHRVVDNGEEVHVG